MAKDLFLLIQKIKQADDMDKVRRELSQIYDLIQKELFDKIFSEFRKFIPPRLIEELEEGFNNGWAKFIKFIKLFDETKSKNPKSWIYKIIKYEILNYFKILSNNKIINNIIAIPVWDDDEEKSTDIVFVEHNHPYTIMITKELDYLINFFFENDDFFHKNPQAKEVIKLSYFEDLNGTQIAKKLNIGDSTITKYKKIIRPRFQEFLKVNGWDINL